MRDFVYTYVWILNFKMADIACYAIAIGTAFVAGVKWAQAGGTL